MNLTATTHGQHDLTRVVTTMWHH